MIEKLLEDLSKSFEELREDIKEHLKRGDENDN